MISIIEEVAWEDTSNFSLQSLQQHAVALTVPPSGGTPGDEARFLRSAITTLTTFRHDWESTHSRQALKRTTKEPSFSPRKRRKNVVPGFQIVPYGQKGQQPRAQNPTWPTKANYLIEKLPGATSWWPGLAEVGLGSSDDCQKFIGLLSLDKQPRESSDQRSVSLRGDKPLENLKQYARVASRQGKDAILRHTAATIRQVVLVSACIVLLNKKKISTVDVDTVMSECVSDSTASNLALIRKGVLWLNRLIGRLCSGPWAERAIWILAIWSSTFSVSYYSTFSQQAPSLDFVLSRLENPHFFSGFQNKPDWPPLTITDKVKELLDESYPKPLRDNLSLRDISLILGYTIDEPAPQASGLTAGNAISGADARSLPMPQLETFAAEGSNDVHNTFRLESSANDATMEQAVLRHPVTDTATEGTESDQFGTTSHFINEYDVFDPSVMGQDSQYIAFNPRSMDQTEQNNAFDPRTAAQSGYSFSVNPRTLDYGDDFRSFNPRRRDQDGHPSLLTAQMDLQYAWGAPTDLDL